MSRNDFLTGIRQHKIMQTLFPPQTEIPNLPEEFGRALTLMGGIWDDTFLHTPQNGYTTLNAYLRGLYPSDSLFCSATPEIIAEVDFSARTQAAALKMWTSAWFVPALGWPKPVQCFSAIRSFA